ncbi:M15 family metallopeptidase [Paenibacillus chungangensis]|uniref:M15 family metallopeptidase n=1 Tax=Paenibacillus chungangensis TaxID=696535 RepID=A0ABW3HSM1_9BACL
MSPYSPQLHTPPHAPPSHTPPPSPRQRRSRNALLILLILFTLAALLVNRYEEVERLLPWAKQKPPSIIGLHPVVHELSEQLVKECTALGIHVVITDGFRSHHEQNTLFQQGRSADGPIVTHAKGGESYHNYGLAIDFALKTKKGKLIWDLEYDGNQNKHADWLEVVAVAKGLGFSWGGDWKSFKDYPHLQMDFGYTIHQLQRGFYPLDEHEAAVVPGQ